MKKIISLFLIGSLLAPFAPMVKAQGGAVVTANNLSPEVKGIIENVKAECGLNPTQTTKFTNDYVSFLNSNEKNLSLNAGNVPKRDEETKRLLLQTGTKFRSYLNDGQFTKLTQMIQAGKLDPAKYNPSVKQTAASQPVSGPVTKAAAAPVQSVLPASVSVQSNVTEIFRQLSPYMKVTADQSAKAIPVLQAYDKSATEIKQSTTDPAQEKSKLDALNAKTISTLKPTLNTEQLQKLVVAATMQENILSGKNLSMNQKAFIDKLRNQYGLNDVQLMAVVLVMVEGKIRGDAVNLIAKTNPQAAAQELGNLLQDLDGRLKSALSADQYIKVKADLEKLLRGQKV